jgi:hypothetical protein
MRKLERLAYCGALLGLLPASMQSTIAQDMPACHDLPASRAVLEEGANALRQAGGTPEGFHPIHSYSKHPLYDSVGLFLDEPQIEAPPTETQAQLEKLDIDTEPTARAAIHKAELLERYNKPALAKIVYDRLLNSIDATYVTDDLRARIWEGEARIGLSIPYCVNSIEESHLLASSFSRTLNFGKRTRTTNLFAIVAAVKQARSEDEVVTAQKFCRQAWSLRRRSVGGPDQLAIDKMILGAIAERENQHIIAITFFIEALQITHNVNEGPIPIPVTEADFIPALQSILHAIQATTATDEEYLQYLAELNEIIVRIPASQPGLAKVGDEVNRLTAFHKEQIRIRPCMEMAEQLNKTAFALERTNEYDMAWKLYQQALEIKQKNLGEKNIETIRQLLDMARAAGGQKRFAVSQSLYKQALATMQSNPQADKSDIVSALENYAQILADSQHNAEANKVYEQAKRLALRGKQKIE